MEPTTSTNLESRRSRTGALLAGFAVAAAAVAGYALLALSPASPTTVTRAVGYLTASVAGAVCLGGLVLVLITARPDDRGVIDAAAFRAHLAVERLSPVWLAAALVMVVMQAASDAGVSATRVLGSGMFPSALGASESARGWVAVAVCALVLTVTSRLVLRWEWHVPLLIPAIVGIVAAPVTGDAGQGPNHDYATGAVIVFALAVAVWAGVAIVAAAVGVEPELRHRVTITTLTAGSVAVGYGAGLIALRVGAGDLFRTGYGRLALLALAAVLAAVVADIVAVRTRRGTPATAAALGALAALAALSATAIQTAPTLLAEKPTVWDILLGYELPGSPTALRLATFWRFDVFLGVVAIVLAGGYLLAMMKLRHRGDRWPVGRAVAWVAGCAALVVATSSGIRSYGSAMFSVHMAEHMTLNMFAPVLLVLGAPVTLALRVLPSAKPGQPPGPREWILRLIHSPITTFLSHPATAFVLFVGSLYAVYFTPLFDTLVRYHWGHEFMAVHFLITGYLFYWGIIGVDPGPRRLPFIGRLALLFAVMPFHAFFGIAMMTMTTTVGANFYRSLALPWVPSINDDQHLGGAIAWGSSEVPLVMVVIALVIQWARQDRRTAVRSDRHADAGYGDDQMDAYNNMLRELAKKR
ncbi:MAG: cytochrome c oxidase assembly protein [Actinomycetota bacterium]|nr:cytochrome c oxidase assembly protein [Actinomycetota bacterium]